MQRRTYVFLFHILISGAAGAVEMNERSPARRVEATVNADGKVVPGSEDAVDIERLTEGATTKGSSCRFGSPMTPDRARALVEKIATEENFYPDFVVAVARAESRFQIDAVSPKGAIGLMQLEPETAKRFGVDICDPADNIRGGVRFLRELHTKYRNPLFILAAYNAGEKRLAEHGGVPPYPETMKFVADVINDFYGWDAVVKSGSGRSRGLPGKSSTGRDNSRAESDERWKSGFVWNVE